MRAKSLFLWLRSPAWLTAAVVAFVCVGHHASNGQNAPGTEGDLRAEKWRQDIRFYAAELPKRHKNLFFHLRRDDFEREVSRIENSVGKLSDDEVIVALMTLTAKVRDGHTTLRPAKRRFRTFPIAVGRYAEGWFVLGVDEKYKQVLGAQLVSVDDTPLDLVEKKVSEVIALENKYWVWAEFPSELQSAEVLLAKGVIRDKARARFGFVGRDGNQIETEITSLAPEELGNLKLARLSAQIKPTFASKHAAPNYSFEYLPESKALYIAYNRCAEAADKPFADFVNEAFAVADREAAQRVIVDVRRNGGGNSAVMQPLLSALRARPHLTGPANLFVLIGRSTFSSGFMNARELQFHHKALWVGEPSGQSPNSYGEVKEFLLPNSDLVVRYSTKFFDLVSGEKRDHLPVDLSVERRFSDYVEGRDPALEKALAHRPLAK